MHSSKKKTSAPKVQKLLIDTYNNGICVLQHNFRSDLYNLFIGYSIRIYKLDNPLFTNLSKTYCEDQTVPSSSILDNKYVEDR